MINLSLIGTLGKDAEIRDAGSTKVINFSVAVNTGYGDKKTTMWIEAAKFGEKTGVCDFLKKGTKVYITGEPTLRTWESNGKSGTTLQIRVQEIKLLSTKGETAPAEAAPTTPKTWVSTPPTENLDNFPF